MNWAMDPPRSVGAPDALDAPVRAHRRPHGARAQDWKQLRARHAGLQRGHVHRDFAILALQQCLPLNPDGKGALERSLIFNTAASFTTNTNLQHYSGEDR